MFEDDLTDEDVYMERRAIKACPLREPCHLYGVCYAEKNGRPDMCNEESRP